MTPSARDQLVARLGDTFAIERELGGGGMARVFVAEEKALGRRVVIKLLEPELAGTIDADRFRREIGFAAQLSHPNLVPLLTAGEIDGLPYYTMPFVKGRTLRDRITQAGTLSVAEAVSIFRDVLRAVSYAHKQGVVHRDLKPENILLSDTGAVVADLGIAKAMGAATGGGTPRKNRTSAGVVLGTPAYMAPEQATGDAAADHRVDLYACGILLYEMLAGRPPFHQGNGPEIMRAHVHLPVPDITEIRRDLPPDLVTLIGRCLAKRPLERPSMADEILMALDAINAERTEAHLVWTAGGTAVPMSGGRSTTPAAAAAPVAAPRWGRRLAMAAAVVMVLGAAGWSVLPRGSRAVALSILGRPAAITDVRRVVVVPFANQTGDSALMVFGDMAADWLTRGLSRTGTVEVVDARTAKVASIIVDSTGVLRFRGREVEIAGETGAGLVVSGRYYREGDRLHVEARLLDVTNDRIIPLASVAGPVDAKAELVERLRARVMGAMAPIVSSDRAWSEGMGVPPSYDSFLEVYHAVAAFARGDTVEAFRRYRRAAELDTTYVVPLVLNAYAHADVGIMDRQPAALATAGALLDRADARRATAIPSDLVMADYVRAQTSGDADAAYAVAREGVRLLPGSDIAVIAAMTAVWAHRPDSALAFLERSDAYRGINLVRPGYWRWKIAALHLADRAGEAADVARLALKQFPDEAELEAMLAMAEAAAGRPESALAALDRVLARASSRPGPRLVHGAASVVQLLAHHGHAAAATTAATRSRAALAFARTDSSVAGLLAWGRFALVAGDRAEARRTFAALAARAPSDARAVGGLALVDALEGNAEAARSAAVRIPAADADPLQRADALVWRGRIHAVLGDAPAALRDIGDALAHGATFGNPLETGVPLVLSLPEFAPLAGDPAFRALARKRG